MASKTAVKPSRYKDKESLVLESPALRVEVLPFPGAKIASFVDKADGAELLIQRPGERYRDQPFGGLYTEAECSGFDDMFPTIDPCACELEPWRGTLMADHGEVWSLPWSVAESDDGVRLAVHGVRFPYTLEKRLRFASDEVLRIDYTLRNESPFPFEFLWAAHVMTVLEEGSRIFAPAGASEVVTLLSRSGRFGSYGDLHPWPAFVAPDGSRHRADLARPASVRDSEKFYFRRPLPEGWAAVSYPSRGRALALSFPVASVPYLGILLNEGGWDGLYNLFLEPCTATFDRPDVAHLRGQGSRVEAKGTLTWYLTMAVGSAVEVAGVDAAGRIRPAGGGRT